MDRYHNANEVLPQCLSTIEAVVDEVPQKLLAKGGACAMATGTVSLSLITGPMERLSWTENATNTNYSAYTWK